MINGLDQLGRERALALFADWTDRIAAGEVPPAPPRPQGLERNVVITQWDWADPKAYLHDVVSTDRRNPSVNANGLLYGALELSADYLPVLDPVRHTASQVPLTVRDPNTPPTPPAMMQPSPYWGSDVLWTSKNNVHNPMFDERGRVWITSAVRPFDNPAYCKEGSSHPSAKLFPIQRSSRHLAMYDPKTKKLTHISTCFGTHHLMFAEDANNTLWTSGGGQVVGWLNTKMFEETGDEEKSQGWTALIIDTNGNGKRDAYVEPNQPVDPTKDKRYGAAFYSVAPAPDGSIWGSVLGFPGAIVRINPGTNPPETTLAEVYEPPFDNAEGRRFRDSRRAAGTSTETACSGPRSRADIWPASTAASARDRSTVPRPPVSTAPRAGRSTLSRLPQLTGVTDNGSAEGSYYTWVDQFDTSGLGANTPIDTGNASEGLLALKDGNWVVLRVPYPTGFYTKWLDGRIDDPKAWLEGQGAVDDHQHARALPHGDRQGYDEQGDQVPDENGSAGEVERGLRRTRRRSLDADHADHGFSGTRIARRWDRRPMFRVRLADSRRSGPVGSRRPLSRAISADPKTPPPRNRAGGGTDSSPAAERYRCRTDALPTFGSPQPTPAS